MKQLFILTNLILFLGLINIKAQEDPFFVVVEQMPKFSNDANGLNNFIAKNLEYPKKAITNKTQGMVVASFIVEKDGSISNPAIVRSVSEECDNEVIRLIKSMPKWIPGVKDGKAVRVKLSIPVTFSL